ncbi:hypothetical protein AMTRI_Chr03g148460 [Amborella trichopoda]|uniref:EGF-like domain-containing protein n=1 Tax=Amborella trichopoda TaxID=13333 RepID=W1P0S3_AMBTC|nr:uncharacterized protein LOC18429623 [Amborella trichopoda]ERN01538.1 hypothetical protein AMTR_s00002p00271200 [Amborella trichopoda]|eukprot:XP_006838969.1 uncharacterized protein LOC18429623 [Amborella trichopoda]
MAFQHLSPFVLFIFFQLFPTIKALGNDSWPFLDNICDTVGCGKGSCKVNTSHAIPFVCECDPGWMQFPSNSAFKFLPCVIPKCTVNYSCDKALTPAPAVAPPTNHSSLLDPCTYAYCGGGTCVKTGGLGFRCECKEAYSNLMNTTTFPCFNNCYLGTDCANLGIGLKNGSDSPSGLSQNTPISGNQASPGHTSSRHTAVLSALVGVVVSLI